MRAFRVLVLSGLLSVVGLFLACGGSGSNPTPPAPLTITTANPLPQATVNNPYNFVIQASGGQGTYTWSMTGGSLPTGLMFTAMQAYINGTPTEAGSFDFTIQVMDTAGHTASANLTLVVEGAVIVTCNSCTQGNLPPGSPNMMYGPATLSATGGVAPYSWCVVETNGNCDNGAGGALPPGLTITTDGSGNGVISGTPTSQPATPLQITVQASDSEAPPARGSISVTLTIFGILPSSLPAGVIYTPYHQAVAAAGGSGPYTFSVASGSLPPGLSFGPCMHTQNPTCPISGTPTQLGNSTFTLQVSEDQVPHAAASQQYTISISSAISNALLNGNYAFALNGYDNGTPFVMAGAFVADGNGNITSGELDRNDGNGSEYNDPSQCRGNPNCPVPETVQSGSVYDLSAGNGTGTMTIKTLDHGSNPHTYQFEIAVSGNACVANVSLSDCGRLIIRDPSNANIYGSGVLKVQDKDFFSVNAFFPGNFALLANGIDPSGNRYAAAGAVGLNPTTKVDIDCNANGWGLTNCPLDQNDNGNAASNAFGGTFSADLDANFGRGNFINLRFPNDPNSYCIGGLGNTTCGYAYYVINKQEMILISGDPLSKPAYLTLWSAYRQKSSATGWTLPSLMGPIVTELTAVDNGHSDVTAGIFNADGAGNATFNSDENDGGTLSRPSCTDGTYAIDSQGNKTGRVTLTCQPQFGANGAVMYLYTGNYGYLVGTDAKVTSGVMEQQSGSPFSNGSVSGIYQGSTAWPAVAGVTNSAAELFADGAGNLAGTQYSSGPNGVGDPTPLSLTYQVDSTGRAVVNQNGNEFGVLYVVGPKKFVLLPTGDDPALSVVISGQVE